MGIVNPEWPVVKEGKWIYGAVVPCSVRILHGDVIYGSSDYEDPPDIQNDRSCDCYYVLYECQGDNSSQSGGVFLSMAEAVMTVEKTVGESLHWE